MFQPLLSDSLLEDPISPQDAMKSFFSFYVREPSNINLFNPSSVSTPKKSHHVSMPTLPARPVPLKSRNLSLDHKKTRKTPLPKTSLQPFLIRVQSSAVSLENAKDTLTREFTKPTRGRKSTGGLVKRTRAQRMKKGGAFWLKACTQSLKRRISRSSTSDDKARARQRAYYFI